MQTSAIRACSYIAECSLSYAKIMQTSAIRACSYIAEPKLILCKDNARREQQQGGETQFYQA